MSTQKSTVDFVLNKLGHTNEFLARPMFGEYALYLADKVVALICDNQLYVKIVPASQELEGVCEKAAPYPGAKPHYLVDEGQLSNLHNLAAILCAIAAHLPAKKKKNTRQ
jgi:TfoX/Sxy family transcriptional regulator of competence genes